MAVNGTLQNHRSQDTDTASKTYTLQVAEGESARCFDYSSVPESRTLAEAVLVKGACPMLTCVGLFMMHSAPLLTPSRSTSGPMF